MEVIFALPLIFYAVVLPVIAGYMAKRLGRNFWMWFFISIPLPFISCFIIASLPDKSIRQEAVESQEIFMELNGIK